MSARNLIRQSNVTLICTTDDPADDLRWHKQLKEDDSFEVQVLPAWRPDLAMKIEKPGFAAYLKTGRGSRYGNSFLCRDEECPDKAHGIL